MVYQKKLLLFLVFVSTFWITVESSTTPAPDPCDANLHAAFPKTANRSVNYDASKTINDRYIVEDWYGEEYIQIPTIAPELNHCGTKYPIYLQVAPQTTTSDIQHVTVCVRNGNNICADTWTILAKVCSSELTVYKLLRSPSSSAGYCLAPSSGSTFPDFITTPTVNTTLEDLEDALGYKQYRFFCDFTANDTNLKYQANWYIDGIFKHKSSFVDFDEDRERSLTDADLFIAGVTTVGFHISCKIRASFSDESQAGLPSGSKEKFIGIEVVDEYWVWIFWVRRTTLTIQEGETGYLHLKPTVPIGCPSGDVCVYGMALQIPPTDAPCSLTVRSDSSCGVQMKTNGGTSALMLIGGITAQYDESSQVVEVILKSPVNYYEHAIWGNYTMAPITVLITKNTTAIQHRTCSVNCDPRINTFSERSMSLQLSGTFTMYENNKYNIEVQFKTFACSESVWGNAYCVCGLVARVGKTVFMINHCNTDHWFIDYILCGDGGDVLDVKKLYSSYYKFTFPNGATMTTYIQESNGNHFLNTDIFPSVVDKGETGGVCGNLTGSNYQQVDDRILKDGSIAATDSDFFTSWGVSLDNTLFSADNLDGIGSLDNVDYITCACVDLGTGSLQKEITCSATNGTDTCVKDEEYRSVNKKRCITPVKRRKRSLPSLYPEYNLPRRIKRSASWFNGWTEQKATDHCNLLFNSSKMVEKCKDVPGVDLVTPMATCMDDIRLSGIDAFALSAVGKIQSQCLYEATMNATLREETVDKPSVLQQVKEVACPGECSQQGQCNKGACICNDGYIGSDCSVNVNEKLLAAGLEADGYCDLTDDKCQEIAVFGGTFIESGDFKCRLNPFQVDRSGTVTPKDSVTMVGLVESIGEVVCPLPVRSSRRRRSSVVIPVVDDTLTGYSVAVSNNGDIYSDSLTMVITNSQCINCSINSGTVTCTFSNNYCYTDGRCYSNNEQHLMNRDYVCNSDKQTWINSKKTVNSEPALGVGVIVGIGVAALLVVIIVLVVVVIVVRNKSNKIIIPVVAAPVSQQLPVIPLTYERLDQVTRIQQINPCETDVYSQLHLTGIAPTNTSPTYGNVAQC